MARQRDPRTSATPTLHFHRSAHGMLVRMHLRLTGRHPLLGPNLDQVPDQDGGLVLDARRLDFAGPLELAATVALAHAANAKLLSTSFITADNPDVTGYMQRMDVIRRMPADTIIDGRLPTERRADLAGTLLEVSPLDSQTADDLATRLGRLVTAHYSSAAVGKIFEAVGELIDNAVDHGTSPQGAFIAAQVYTGVTSGRRGFEVAICDTGIGILAHLRRNPAHAAIADAPSALACALKPGVSGTTEDRGNGLSDLLTGLEFGGLARFHLRSGAGLATVTVRSRRLSERSRSTTTPVQGTWAWLRVRIP
jgi:hypothetical protein